MPVQNTEEPEYDRLFAVRASKVARGQTSLIHLAPQRTPHFLGEKPYPGPGDRALCGSNPRSHFYQVSGTYGPDSLDDVCGRCVARIKPEHILPRPLTRP